MCRGGSRRTLRCVCVCVCSRPRACVQLAGGATRYARFEVQFVAGAERRHLQRHLPLESCGRRYEAHGQLLFPGRLMNDRWLLPVGGKFGALPPNSIGAESCARVREMREQRAKTRKSYRRLRPTVSTSMAPNFVLRAARSAKHEQVRPLRIVMITSSFVN